MKLLVLGANGMAGHMITLYLKEKNHEVYSVSRNPIPFCEGLVSDVFAIDTLRDYIKKNNFDTIINCIGLLNTACDEHISQAVFINSYLPHFLADIVHETVTKIIHLSTDCVFSGKKGNYNEYAIPDGESYYDRSKALGEINDNYNLTFRNSIIGPDMNVNGIGLFNWFMKQQNEIFGYSNVLWNGVTTLVLAQAIDQAMTENLSGIYHLVSPIAISKYNLLQLFNKYFKDDSITIKENSDIYINKTLVNNRKDFSFKVPCYEDMIADLRKWTDTHDFLYEHYKNGDVYS